MISLLNRFLFIEEPGCVTSLGIFTTATTLFGRLPHFLRYVVEKAQITSKEALLIQGFADTILKVAPLYHRPIDRRAFRSRSQLYFGSLFHLAVALQRLIECGG